ncbi:MAG: amidohydrolase family protein [Pseudomonadota bacterium]
MPDFPIIDAHLHVWDPSNLPYAWLSENETLNGSFLLPDYDAAVGDTRVEQMVFVECDIDEGSAVDEIRWIDELAQSDPRLAAYVAHAPVNLGDKVLPYLEALEPFTRMRGIRRLIQAETEPGYCIRPPFIDGVRQLERFDWSFDVCILAWQMEDVIKLVDACPKISFVLDHLGKPSIREGALHPWRDQMFRLAERDNVVCKLSGVATEADHARWTRDDLAPFIDTALEAFGPSRLMFAGDWPVATMAISADRWIAEVDWSLTGLSTDEQREIYGEVARRAYRFSSPG